MGMIEQQLMEVDRGAAMNLMVLEARLRECFQSYEKPTDERMIQSLAPIFNDLSLDEIQALIPQDLPMLPEYDREVKSRRKKTLQTMGLAAALALITGLGVFGFASIVQVALTWIS
jgi:hypothetical protein